MVKKSNTTRNFMIIGLVIVGIFYFIDSRGFCSEEDVQNWVNENGGAVSGYDTLCGLVGGEESITDIRMYEPPLCTYYQYKCELLTGEEVLSWHIHYQGNCEHHALLDYNEEYICPAVRS